MSFPWRDEHMQTFLQIYRKHDCLWNNKSENYHKSHIREEAYKSILSEMNLSDATVSDIKAKIKTIRTRYCSELAKIRKSLNSGASWNEQYVPRLFWFQEADSFLRAVSTPKDTLVQDPVKKHSKSVEIFQETDVTQDNQIEVQTELLNSRLSHANSTTVLCEGSEQPIREFPDNSTMKRTKKRKYPDNRDSIHGAIKKLTKLVDINRKEKQLHEFDVFCNSLAIQLKKMPLRHALLCQEKLQSVMTQQRLSLINSENHTLKLENYASTSSPGSIVSGETFSTETSPYYNFGCKEEIP